ncbi:hypothetical protein FOIG_14290 [Fusarium odoratissimum NRRL 54006]|uniref:Uncharacterized protein n=2 Tax=Fusarium oxysporum species complex TaxID=171631 RepID=X0J907_FUSO5|nr:uncharacterized protein FOIG_14290 [Fusarium odoratissimum NRRL 54006]EXL92821.1 hypothetical protein FOIG_14290 [Fusarium odoratissimum NRRL 54006]
MILQRGQLDFNSSLVLATIDALKKAGCIQAQLRDPQPRFRACHIYPMEARRVLWRRLLFQYLRREIQRQIYSSHDFEKDYRQIKSIRGSPAGWMDKWENVDWQSRKEELTGFKLRDYKDEKGSDKLGGHDFDITTMTEIERWRHEDK